MRKERPIECCVRMQQILVTGIRDEIMATRRRQRFVHFQTAWMLATLVLLVVLNALTLELFFVISLIGLLIVVEFTAPFAVTPRWRARLRWIILLGLIGFGYVIVQRILALLPSGIL